MSRQRLNTFWYWLARWGCRLFCLVCFRFRAYGCDNVPEDGPVILAGNHQSYLDPVFCGSPLKRHLTYLARDTLFKNKYFGRLISSVNAIPVRRGQADISAVKAVIAALRRGKAVCIYPEATRTSDGRIANLKAGFGLLCRRSKAVVVPVLIDGAFECWSRHNKLFRFQSPVTIHYGEPITPDQIAEMTNDELAMVLTETLRGMQTDIRMKFGKQPYAYV